VMFGPVDNEENRGLIDLDLREKLVMVAMILPIIWIGLYPEALLRRIEPSVIDLLEKVERGAHDAAMRDDSRLAQAAPALAPPISAEVSQP
jgi:NADH-quinone oxidoreductase subunit M